AEGVHLGRLLLEAPDERHLGQQPPRQLAVEAGRGRCGFRLRHRCPPGTLRCRCYRVLPVLLFWYPLGSPSAAPRQATAPLLRLRAVYPRRVLSSSTERRRRWRKIATMI